MITAIILIIFAILVLDNWRMRIQSQTVYLIINSNGLVMHCHASKQEANEDCAKRNYGNWEHTYRVECWQVTK
jgi:hypothetical protein